MAGTANGTLLHGRYRVIDELATGGGGTVVVAWDERMRRRVAIKEIEAPHGVSAESLMAEARTAAMLSHPNIVAVYDVESTAYAVHIIMEYVEGATLSQLRSEFEAQGLPQPSPDVAASVVKQLAAALEFAHRNGVLHLDIKPANVLVNLEGHVKVADFGIADLSTADGHGSAIGGTIGYMPLEQLTAEPATELTDEWAFAAVTYELLTGEYPYQDAMGRRGATFERMVAAQEADEPHLLETGNPGLDEALARALSRNPDARYLSVAAFADDALENLGNPDAGRRELHATVSEMNRDEPDDWLEGAGEKPRRHRRDDGERVEWWRYLDRVFAALVAGLTMWDILGVIPSADWPLTVGMALLGGVIAAASPRLGFAVVGIAVGVAALVGSLWGFGTIALLVVLAWWLFVGRHSELTSVAGALCLWLAVQINAPGALLSAPLAQLFADNLLLENAAVLTLLILVSLPRTIRIWRER